MNKTIEEMIKSGCTYEEAMDALQNMWESAATEREFHTKEAEARQNIITDYRKYLQIIYPTISEKYLEQSVAQLESTLLDIRNIYTSFAKNKELQLKSKEESKVEDAFEAWFNGFLDKIKEERKDAESASKTDKARPKRPSTSLDDFLREMGW